MSSIFSSLSASRSTQSTSSATSALIPATTVCKARLSIADIDRHYYQSHQLTLAYLSTETIRKSMMRIVAYIYNANDKLTVRNQQWQHDQPELLEQSSDNQIKLWIDFGQPDVKRIKKACRLSKSVIVYSYNQDHTDSWWDKNKDKLSRFKNLEVFSVNADELEKLNNKRMTLNCTLQDGDLQINDGANNLIIERERLM
ncbi:YaeQ family protein [uncultured Cocleimonas sp.]|uniref:YaeQ family protein n=1 Tax=uncultured Cocleimonas sp. TaxID=1051587 RepID=UPI0026064018|nr:YaeQ family protein [uncultured Cocleimonas sp.]